MVYTEYIVAGVSFVVAGGGAYLVYQKKRGAKPPSLETEEEDLAVEPESIDTPPPTGVRSLAETSSLSESEKLRLMNAAWYRCENPDCNHSRFLRVHHIVSEIEGGTNRLDNLLVLCSECHATVHESEISVKELKSWVRNRPERFKCDLDWPYG